MGAKVKCNRCEEVIESKYTHDFVRCLCGAIYVDGGHDYLRIGGHREDWDIVHPCSCPSCLSERGGRNV